MFSSVWTNINENELASRFISLTDLKGFAHYSFTNEIENIKQQTTNVLKKLGGNN